MRDISRHQYIALDGLRGLAALIVVEYHARTWFSYYLPQSPLAVDFFFLLSGFVIAHAYDTKLANGSLSFWRFFALRIIRLYPLYLLAVAIMAVSYIGYLSEEDLRARTFFAFFLVPNLAHEAPRWMVVASWSLFFEIGINLFFAAFHRHLTTKILALMSAIGFALCVVYALKYNSLNVGFTWPSIPGGLGRVMFSFPLGVLIYRHRHLIKFSAPWAAWPSFVLLAAVLAFPTTSTTRPYYDLVAIVFFLPAILVFASTALPNARSIPMLSWLGAISYAIYILHGAFFRLVNTNLGLRADIIAAQPWAGALVIALIVVFCTALDRWYDMPVRRWLLKRNNLSKVRQYQQPETAP